MHHFMLVAATAILMTTLGACGSASHRAGDPNLLAKQPHWTGTIRAREARTGEAAPTKPPAMYHGNVMMTRIQGDISRTSVYILLSGPPPVGSGSISWVLASGRCGAVEAPILPVSSFDPLDMGTNGRAEATVTIPFEFPSDGMYHVDFFSGHTARLTEVVACADLKFKA